METVVDEWNKLPSEVINATMFGGFKDKLDKCMTNNGWV